VKPVELFEPLFQYVCALSRMAKQGRSPKYDEVRAKIEDLLEEIRRDSEDSRKLAKAIERLSSPIRFFIDDMIAGSRLSIAAQWDVDRLAFKIGKGERAGSEKFFEYLDEDLANTGEDSIDLLMVYYTCLSLGFRGSKIGPDELRPYLSKLRSRLRGELESESASEKRLAGEPGDEGVGSYYRITRDFRPPETNRIGLLTLMSVFLVVVGLIVYYGLYLKASDELRDSIGTIVKRAPKT
jgi:type IV/VI secretion system ImpK/VasF family protein